MEDTSEEEEEQEEDENEIFDEEYDENEEDVVKKVNEFSDSCDSEIISQKKLKKHKKSSISSRLNETPKQKKSSITNLSDKMNSSSDLSGSVYTNTESIFTKTDSKSKFLSRLANKVAKKRGENRLIRSMQNLFLYDKSNSNSNEKLNENSIDMIIGNKKENKFNADEDSISQKSKKKLFVS